MCVLFKFACKCSVVFNPIGLEQIVTLEFYYIAKLLLDENNCTENSEIEFRLKCFVLDPTRLGCRHTKPSSGYAGVDLSLEKNWLK